MIVVLMIPSMALAYTENDEIGYLQSLGIPNDVFALLSSEKIHDLYLRAKAGTLEYLGKDTIFLNTNEGDTSTIGTIPSKDMSLDIIAICVLKTDKVTIDGVIFIIDYAWATGHPSVQKEDAIVVNWDAALFRLEENSFESEDALYIDNELFGTCNVNDYPMALNQGGLGYSVEFYPVVNVANASFRGSASFELKPKAKMNYYEDNNRYSTAVNVQYTHDKTPVGFSLGFAYNGLSVSITPTPLADSVAKPKTIYYS